MKKVLSIVAVLLVLAVGGILAAASMQPSEFRIERSLSVQAPPSAVYTVVSDLQRFPEWSPWEKLDPAMQRTIEAEPGKIGSFYRWDGNDDVGAGVMTVVEAKPDERVDMKLEFLRPWPSTSTTIWSLAPEGEGTRVSWAMVGTNDGLLPKVMCLFMDMDKLVGKDFETGLASLKGLVEKS